MIGKKFILYIVFILLLSFSAFAAPGLDGAFDILGEVANLEIEMPHPGYGGGEVNLWLLVGTFLVLYWVFYSLIGYSKKLEFLGGEEKVKKGFSIGLSLVAVFAAPLVEWLSELLTILFEFGLILGYIGIFALLYLGFLGIVNLTKLGEKRIKEYAEDEEETKDSGNRRKRKNYKDTKNIFKNLKDFEEGDSRLENHKSRIVEDIEGHYKEISEESKNGQERIDKNKNELDELLEIDSFFSEDSCNDENELLKRLKKIREKFDFFVNFLSDRVLEEIDALEKESHKVDKQHPGKKDLVESISKLRSEVEGIKPVKIKEKLSPDKIYDEKGNIKGEEYFSDVKSKLDDAVKDVRAGFIATMNQKKKVKRFQLEGNVYKHGIRYGEFYKRDEFINHIRDSCNINAEETPDTLKKAKKQG